MSADLNIIQLSDLHIFGDPGARLLGINTRESFESVWDHVRRMDSPDMVLVTGDLSQDQSPASYDHVGALLSELSVPIYCLPGNHDDGRVMARILPRKNVFVTDRVRMNNWVLAFLDSNIPMSNAGTLADRELARMDEILSAHPNSHSLVCFHHQPIPLGAEWINPMKIDNAAAFFERLKPHSHVKGIIFGHVHHEVDQQMNGWRLLGCPSTNVQFKPRCRDFTVEAAPPAFRTIQLGPDGKIQTGVHRVGAVPPGLDIHSKGY